ncbi:YihY/virulence factor BrkB family protein [Agromyces soli]
MVKRIVERVTALVERVTAWALRLKPVRAFLLYLDRRGPMLADSVTYRALFALFAGVLLGFSVAGIWLASDDQAMQALIEGVDRVIPGLIGEDGAIDPDDLVQPIAFSVTGVIALVGLLGTSIGAMFSLGTAFRQLADLPGDPTFYPWLVLRNLALAIGFGVALGASAIVTAVGSSLLDALFGASQLENASTLAQIGGRLLALLVVLAIDAVAIAVLFRVMSGLRPRGRALWSGSLLGAAGLGVLQLLSELFIGGASANPLLASFAALVALLLWLNLSSQVILIAAAYIVTGVDEAHDRIQARYGAPTFALRRLQSAERRAMAAVAEVEAARAEVEKERR